MSLTAPNFTAVQVAGSLITMRLTDTSEGSDGSISTRRVYVRLADGTYLKPAGTDTDYFLWSYGLSTIDVDILTADYSPTIIVLWVDAGGSTLYTKEKVSSFTGYEEEFYYNLTQGQAGNPNELLDKDYIYNKIRLRVWSDSANQAVSFASDSAAAQNCLNRAQYMIENQNLFF